jgi:type III restriction enzyme
VDKEGTERLYFVVETKSSLFAEDLREKERAKIKCGEAHFKALADRTPTSARFVQATKIDHLFEKL